MTDRPAQCLPDGDCLEDKGSPEVSQRNLRRGIFAFVRLVAAPDKLGKQSDAWPIDWTA